MRVDTDDLVTGQDIAVLADVKQAAMWNWPARHDDFPEPVFKSSRTTLWRWKDVSAWLVATRRMEPFEGVLRRCTREDCLAPFISGAEFQDYCKEHRR